MDHIVYVVLSILLVAVIVFSIRLLRKKNQQEIDYNSVAECQASDHEDDDFMCIMKADGSTISTSKGVVVKGTKISN